MDRLRRIDDAVFAVEQALVATALSAMSVMVFIDVVFRRVAAQDSKVGEILAKVAGISDEGTRAFIDGTIAPWVGLALGFALLWFGAFTGLRQGGAEVSPARKKATLFGAVSCAVIAVLAYAMPKTSSGNVYLAIYLATATGITVHYVRKKPSGWVPRVAVLWVVGLPLFLFGQQTLPQGYTWSQELALLLILWVGFLGASVCAHEGKHLKIEAAEKIIPEALQRWFYAVGFLGAAAFCAFMGLLGYRYCVGLAEFSAPFGEQLDIPGWVAMGVVPVAFGISTLRFLGASVSAALGGDYGRDRAEGSHP